MENSSESISKTLYRWAYEQQATLEFSRLGKPTNNLYIESFNSRSHDESLSVRWFLSLAGAQEKIEQWRREHNGFRPHS